MDSDGFHQSQGGGEVGGGWKDAYPESPIPLSMNFHGARVLEAGGCGQAVVTKDQGCISQLSAEVFMREYYAKGVPVLVKGGATHVRKAVDFSLQGLVGRAGRVQVDVGRIPYERSFSKVGEPPLKMTLAAFVQSMRQAEAENATRRRERIDFTHLNPPLYVFQSSNDSSLFSGLSPADLLPPWITRATIPTVKQSWNLATPPPPPIPLLSVSPPPRAQFFLGPPLSGAPFHFHKDAVNFLAFGKKQWWLSPPANALYSTLPVLAWASTNHSAAPQSNEYLGFHCIQEEGDALYVPAGWGHAVLNLATSIGVAVEWTSSFNMF